MDIILIRSVSAQSSNNETSFQSPICVRIFVLSHCIQLSSIRQCSGIYVIVWICDYRPCWYLNLADPAKQHCSFLISFDDTW